MKTFVAVLLLSGVLLSVGISETLAGRNPGPNMEWSKCGGHPGCAIRCDQQPDGGESCPPDCHAGYICTNGHVRLSGANNAPCVLDYKCPPGSPIFGGASKESWK